MTPFDLRPARNIAAGEAPTGRQAATATIGTLPEWDLSDLYAATDAPEVAADLRRASDEALAF